MIKQAYFRGLMKVAQATEQQLKQAEQDIKLAGGSDVLYANELQNHGFYKGTPIVQRSRHRLDAYKPATYRYTQADASAIKFAPSTTDPIWHKLMEYYQNIGRQNRDFYLKQGFRPPANHQYKTPFPYPNHPKKKQMMQQNQHQVRNTRGAQDYSGHA